MSKANCIGEEYSEYLTVCGRMMREWVVFYDDGSSDVVRMLKPSNSNKQEI